MVTGNKIYNIGPKVTGAGSGIGRKLSLRLAELGAEVYAVSKTESRLESLRSENASIRTICIDLADWKATREALSELPVMDGLVNNAGKGQSTPFMDVSEEELDTIFDINVKSIVNVSQMVVKKMIDEKISGSIVNVSSQASSRALPNHTSYGASKAAVDQITRSMAKELGPFNIRTNAVNPTVTLTPMAVEHWSDPVMAAPMLDRIPLHRFAKTEEVVEPILGLLSDMSAMINGATLPIDGGFLIG